MYSSKAFFLLSENRASEVDGNVARAREWSEKFQYNRVSKRLGGKE